MSDLQQVRAALVEIDTAIHNLWELGKNMVVGWAVDDDGIEVALAPCHRVLAHAATTPRLLNGPRLMDSRTFRDACKVLQARVLRLPVPVRVGGNLAAGHHVDVEAVDSVIRRYSIIRTEHRAVILFESLGFANASPVGQMTQFVSLEHSLGTAAELMAEAGMPVELARSTAGDGALFVWNRHEGLTGDLRTYAVMILALIDNALARASEGLEASVVPSLRTAFTVGPHYSYHQVEANRPRTFEYATGQVTISLARMASHGLPSQILIGSFERPIENGPAAIDTVLFVARAEKILERLSGCKIGDQVISEIRSLVGGGTVGGADGIIKYSVDDKHGYRHEVFNLRAKAARDGASIELGLRTKDLTGFAGVPALYEVPLNDTGAGGRAESIAN